MWSGWPSHKRILALSLLVGRDLSLAPTRYALEFRPEAEHRSCWIWPRAPCRGDIFIRRGLRIARSQAHGRSTKRESPRPTPIRLLIGHRRGGGAGWGVGGGV